MQLISFSLRLFNAQPIQLSHGSISITFYSFVIIATDRAIVKQLTAIYT